MIKASIETFQVISLDDIPERLWGHLIEMNEDSYVDYHLKIGTYVNNDKLANWLRKNVENIGDKILIERQ